MRLLLPAGIFVKKTMLANNLGAWLPSIVAAIWTLRKMI